MRFGLVWAGKNVRKKLMKMNANKMIGEKCIKNINTEIDKN